MKHHLITVIVISSLMVGLMGRGGGYAQTKDNLPGNKAQLGGVHLKGTLTSEKIFMNGDGQFGFSLELNAEDVIADPGGNPSHVDMIIVLDQSGSMSGSKIDDAKAAILNLLSVLSPQDRFALVGYANHAEAYADLTFVTPMIRSQLASIVRAVQPGGGTNLGAGLSLGMRMHTLARAMGNRARIVLVSDGLANQGITDPEALTTMAGQSAQRECPVTAVGVGTDFNEMLMTGIADRGMGGYYFLETPASFFQVFTKELSLSRNIAASSIEIKIPLPKGVVLESAGGYPIVVRGNMALFYPGELSAGARRKLFLKFRAPVHHETAFHIEGIQMAYRFHDESMRVPLDERFEITCTADREEVVSSINKGEWEQQVLQDDYNTLKEQVACDVKEGKKADALEKISAYRDKQERMNAVLKSAKVADNLVKDLPAVEETVKESFTGSSHEVEYKQKRASKALQFEAYQGKRDKK